MVLFGIEIPAGVVAFGVLFGSFFALGGFVSIFGRGSGRGAAELYRRNRRDGH